MADLKLRQAHKFDESELNPSIEATRPDEDFIPYVGYYDESTIITKNGELMQTIRITGFNHESISSELVNLREAIRDSLTKNIKTTNFAIWLQTIRRKKNIAPKGKFKDYFSKKLNEAWEEENQWENQFINELYLTIIISGYSSSIAVNPKSLIRSFFPKSTRNLHYKKLTKSFQVLSTAVGAVLGELNAYGAKLLKIKEWDGVLYSEHLRFLGKIVNLCEDRYEVTTNDLTDELIQNYKTAIGNNSLEVSGNKKKHFSSMFTIKEYLEISVESLDKFLQLPQEFIITQSVDFISRNKALAEFDYQNYILDVSGDDQLKYISGLDRIIESDVGSATDYGEQQITIMLINESTAGLKKDIGTALSKLHELGLVTVREDIFSEHCFWSQLPGNFSFLRRQKAINISSIGGFASLHNFPAGNREGNHWGDAVTMFRTILGTPYFFNFHEGDNGHTIIIGPHGSGKTVLLNFLIAQSRKFNNKLYYFGYNLSGKIFINALGGNYLSITNKTNNPNALRISPFNLDNIENHKGFLSDWFKYLVSYGANPIENSELDLIPQIVDKIIEQKVKTLSQAAQYFKFQSTKNIYKKLLPWHSKGKYSFIFDHTEKNDLSINDITAFNLTPILGHKHILIPVISYLLYKIEMALDGSPTIIVLDEAWKLIDNYATGPKINAWLNRLRKNNCMVVFASESAEDAAKSNITKKIDKDIATHIYLPDPDPTQYYQTVFGLNDEEFELLSAMSDEDRHFLFKHGEDSVIASLDLSQMQEMVVILSSNKETVAIMEEVQKECGKDPEVWIPAFFEVLINQ